MIKLFLFLFVFPKAPRLIKGHNILQFLNPFYRLTHWVQKNFFAAEINEILRIYQECTRGFKFENENFLNTMIEQLFTCK